MIAGAARRIILESDPRVLIRFLWNFGWKGTCSVRRFRRRSLAGEHFPAFLFISITDRCNLHCQGCWVSTANPPRELDLASLDRIVTESKRQGVHFFGLLGGEPLLHRGLADLLGKHRDCYFLLFTNGTLLTAEFARQLRRLGNASPLISIEGDAGESDRRRGGKEVLQRSLEGLRHCRRQHLITGVATSVCRANIDQVANQRFVDEIVRLGAHYLWYYIYRPVGPQPSPELALDTADVIRLRHFLVEIRRRAPLLVVDAYWDHEGRAICPAAIGISHHIGPGGGLEPCPPIQFADSVASGQADLAHQFGHSPFLDGFRRLAGRTGRGCLLLERPDLLRDLVCQAGAQDTGGRGAGLAELQAMTRRPSHDLPGHEIPEPGWFYRFAKKNWFFGFGAYG